MPAVIRHKKVFDKRPLPRPAVIFCLAALLFLAGCGSKLLVQDLSQKQAREVVAVLNMHGILAEAKKETGAGGRYHIQVDGGLYQQAIALLYEKGLPSEERQSFDELISKRGILPDSRAVEALRLDRAMAAEIEEVLSALPAIASSRVVVRLHEFNLPLANTDADKKAGVSLLLVKRAGAPIKPDDVMNIVQRAVPGITTDKVSLLIYNEAGENLSAAPEGVMADGKSVLRVPLTNFLWLWKVAEDDYTGLAVALFVLLLGVFALAASFGYSLATAVQEQRMKKKSQIPRKGQSPRVSGVVCDDLLHE